MNYDKSILILHSFDNQVLHNWQKLGEKLKTQVNGN